MADRTLTAMYDTSGAAEYAREQLLSLGIAKEAVQVTGGETATGASESGSHGGFWSGLMDFFMPEEERHLYDEGVRRGHYVLTAQVPDENAERAMSILESTEPVDIDERSAGWTKEGWTNPHYGKSPRTHAPLTEGGAVFDDTDDDVDEEVAPVEVEPARAAPTLAQERAGTATTSLDAAPVLPAGGPGPSQGRGVRVRSYGPATRSETAQDTLRRGVDDGTDLNGETGVGTGRVPLG